MRNVRLGLLGVILAVSFIGCGGADVTEEVEKSENAPTQADFDQMQKEMMKTQQNLNR